MIRVLEVGEPFGKIDTVLDERLYTIKAENELGETVELQLPMCLSRKSVRIALESAFKYRKQNNKPPVEVGDWWV